MKTATPVRDLPDWDGDATLYRLDPPHEYGSHVIVSTANPSDGGEHGSLVLAASPGGEVRSWAPIHTTEATDHTHVLAELGYEVTP